MGLQQGFFFLFFSSSPSAAFFSLISSSRILWHRQRLLKAMRNQVLCRSIGALSLKVSSLGPQAPHIRYLFLDSSSFFSNKLQRSKKETHCKILIYLVFFLSCFGWFNGDSMKVLQMKVAEDQAFGTLSLTGIQVWFSPFSPQIS